MVFGSISIIQILPKNGGGDVRIVIVFEMMGYKTLQMLFVFLLQSTFEQEKKLLFIPGELIDKRFLLGYTVILFRYSITASQNMILF